MLKVEVNQKILRGGQKLPRRSLDKIFRLVSQKTKTTKNWPVSLAFVSPAQIKKLNQAYRGKNQPTDVLSFGWQKPNQAPQGEPLGEIVVCYPVARRHALADGLPVRQEVYRLIVHGLLHLLGYQHATEGQAKKMFALQEEIVQKI